MATATSCETPPPARDARLREMLAFRASLVGHTHAQVLGLAPGASATAVRLEFVKLARRFHPDAFDADDPEMQRAVQAIFMRVTQAYQSLSADTRRRDGASAAEKVSPAAARATAKARGHAAAPEPAVPPVRAPAPAPGLLPAPAPAPASAPPVAQPPAPSPAAAAPVVDPAVRVDQALEEARNALAHMDAEAAVNALHPLVSLGSPAQRRTVRLLLARAYVADARWQRYGLALLREMTQENPNDAEALTILGSLYRKEGLLARAEATVARALEADPRLPEARSLLKAIRAERDTAGPEAAQGLMARLRRKGR